MNSFLTLLVDATPFLLYSLLLVKSLTTWRRLSLRIDIQESDPFCGEYSRARNRSKTNMLSAILFLLTLGTLTFMASNAYALAVLDKTFLSMRVFQMFVVSNCAAYWLVLDLISRNASPDEV